MNPLTKVKLINELNEREAHLGVKETVSWHSEYKDSAWIFVGGFPYDLTEGDLICVFSQYGEIVNINLVRDKKTGKSKGFCFICYEDQRSTILAVDNFNGIKIKGRTIRVDHVKDYRPPKDSEDIDDITKQLREDGCAPRAPEHSSSSEEDEQYIVPVKKHKKDKKQKKKKKKSSSSSPIIIKQEKIDNGYDQQRAPKYSRSTTRQQQPRSEGLLSGRHGDQRNGEQAREERRREGGNEQVEWKRGERQRGIPTEKQRRIEIKAGREKDRQR